MNAKVTESMLLHSLFEAAERRKGFADLKDITKVLQEKYRITKNEISSRWLRSLLDRMQMKGLVKKVTVDNRTLYIPVPQTQLTDFLDYEQNITSEESSRYISTIVEIKEDESKTREELQEEAEYQIIRKKLPEEIYALLAKQITTIDKVIGKYAEELATLNPKNLFLDMLKGYKNLFEKYRREIDATPNVERKKKLLDRLNNISERIVNIYGRVLGIPISESKTRGREGIEAIRIVTPADFNHPAIFEFDEDLVNEFLVRRIPDDYFIVYETPITAKRFIYLGLDSSTAFITIRFPYLSPRDVDLIINTAVTTRISGSEMVPPRPDFFPKPESLVEITSESAEEKGYIIRPYTYYGMPPAFRSRLREAQMNKLEHQIAREMFNDIEKTPNLLYFDGRLFPYEHKLDDFTLAPHKKFVRHSINAFRALLTIADMRKRTSILVGVVKRGYLGYLWYLVQWFAFKKGLINENELFDLYSMGIVYSDNIMAAKLLAALRKKEEKKVPRTFSIIRRFYAMDDKLLRQYGKHARNPAEENDEEFWQMRIDLGTDNKGILGYIEEYGGVGATESVAWMYSEVCAQAAVAMFYFLPPEEEHKIYNTNQEIPKISMPRYEVLIPYSVLILSSNSDLQNFRTKIRKLVANTIVAPVIKGTDNGKYIEEQFYIFYNEPNVKVPTIVPSLIMASHKAAVDFRNALSKVYSGYITMYVAELFEKRRRRM